MAPSRSRRRSQSAAIARLERIEARQRALDAERLRCIGDLVADAADEIDHRSLRAELALVLGASEYAAERLMLLADLVMRRYPTALGSLETGEINARHVEVIVEAGRVIGDGEDPETAARHRCYGSEALERAMRMTPNRLRAPARRLAEAWAETPIETRHARARNERRVFVVDGEDGMADLIAHLPAIEAYAIRDRLTRIAKSAKRGERSIPIPGGAGDGSRAGDASDPGRACGEATLAEAGEDPSPTAGRPSAAAMPATAAIPAMPAGDEAPVSSARDGRAKPGASGAETPGVGAEVAPGASGAETREADRRTRDQFRADALVDLLLSADPFSLKSGCPAEAIEARIQLIAPSDLVEGPSVATDPSGAPCTASGPSGASRTASEHSGAPRVSDSDADELLGELIGFGPVSMDAVRDHAARSRHFEKVTADQSTGDVLSVDRYRPSEEMRRRLGARDRHCLFPGCRVPVHRCDLDHTVDAAKGGATSTDNLAYLCRGHHVTKHRSEWTVEQQPGGTLTWTSPTGREHVDRPPGAYEPPLRRRGSGAARPPGEQRSEHGYASHRTARVRFTVPPEEAEPEPAPRF